MLVYPWTAYETVYPKDADIFAFSYTYENANRQALLDSLEEYVENQIDLISMHQVNDLIVLAIQNSLRNTTNTNTLALARNRIPGTINLDTTNRFLVALMYEKQLGFPGLVEIARNSIVHRGNKYTVNISTAIINEFRKWNGTAVKVVELMARFESQMPLLAGDGFEDFVRASAMVESGERIGIEVRTSTTPALLAVKNKQGISTYHLMPANFTINMPKLEGIYNVAETRVGTAVPVTVKGVNGASLVTTYSGPDYANRVKNPVHLLNKDATYQLSYTLMQHAITSEVIEVPSLARTLSAISLVTGTTESVSLANLFKGTRLTITARAFNPRIITSIQINEAQTSMGLVGGNTGSTTVRITATNESGSGFADLRVTVTAS